MAGSGSSFSKCPSYVPLVAVRGVRDLLLDLEREGSPAFAAFKRRWEHSALPALLYEATLPVPASLRACAAPHLQGAAAGAGLPPSGSEGAESGSCPDRKLCVRHLYAAATSFLAGMWGDEREAEGASPLVQVGAVFTLFCLYWGQPEHARLPIPLTPAGWKHLLHLCERAKLQKSAARATATEPQEPSDAAQASMGLDLADFRSAYARLHGVGAFTFCCAPAALEDESFRRPDVRDTGVWGNSIVHDVPSHRNAEQSWLKIIGESDVFLQQLQAKETVMKSLDLDELSSALQSYTAAKEELRQNDDSIGPLVPNYVDPDLHSTLHTLLNPRPRPPARPPKNPEKLRHRTSGDAPVDVLQRAMDDFDEQAAAEQSALEREEDELRAATRLQEGCGTKKPKAEARRVPGAKRGKPGSGKGAPGSVSDRLTTQAKKQSVRGRGDGKTGRASQGGKAHMTEEAAEVNSDGSGARAESDDGMADMLEEELMREMAGSSDSAVEEEETNQASSTRCAAPAAEVVPPSRPAKSGGAAGRNSSGKEKSPADSQTLRLPAPAAHARTPKSAAAPAAPTTGESGSIGGRGRGRGAGRGREEEDFIDVAAGLRRLEHSRTHFGAVAPAARDLQRDPAPEPERAVHKSNPHSKAADAASKSAKSPSKSADSPATAPTSKRPHPHPSSSPHGERENAGQDEWSKRGEKSLRHLGATADAHGRSQMAPSVSGASSAAPQLTEKEDNSETAQPPAFRRNDLRVRVPASAANPTVSAAAASSDRRLDGTAAPETTRPLPGSAVATGTPSSARAPLPPGTPSSARAPLPLGTPSSARAPLPPSPSEVLISPNSATTGVKNVAVSVSPSSVGGAGGDKTDGAVQGGAARRGGTPAGTDPKILQHNAEVAGGGLLDGLDHKSPQENAAGDSRLKRKFQALKARHAAKKRHLEEQSGGEGGASGNGAR